MRPPALRRAIGALISIALACATGACRQPDDSAVEVVVIGGEPRIVDPTGAPLDAATAVLHANVAQGLVRFDANGQIEPGLAERWTVTDDGLSYIFRLASAEWPSGGRITSEQVARVLRRHMAARSKSRLKDPLGAVDEIVAMTDRVIEIRLSAPRPNLLQLLAQPELGILRNGESTGPFRSATDEGRLVLTRETAEGENSRLEEVRLRALTAPQAVTAFARGDADLVLGGTFADLAYAHRAQIGDDQLRFDPVAGLFGLVPTRAEGRMAEPEVRRLLSQAIDRVSLVASLNVPGLAPRATILQPGLESGIEPAPPPWLEVPIGDRRPDLISAADGLFGQEDQPRLRIHLPDGPGAELLLRRLANDWGLLGIAVERAASRQAADLALVDEVAPSTSSAWFLRHFRCEATPVCEAEVDELLAAARTAPVGAQRAALLSQAATRIDELQLFIPLTAPVRWSLVAERVVGFAGNRFARHTLTSLGERPEPQGE